MSRNLTFVRIYISEADRGRHGSLSEEILEILHEQHRVHGVTVFRGVAGFGSGGVVRAADLLRLSPHLPLVIEFFDEPNIVAAAVDAVKDLIPAGHMVSWPVQCNAD